MFAIQGLIALGSLATAFFAGWALFYRFASPKLEVRLRNPKGEILDQENKSRFYHLVVTNKRPRIPAENVNVFLAKIEILEPNGQWNIAYKTGPLPLIWQYSHIHKQFPSTWDERFCDFGCITPSGEFAFQIATKPIPVGFKSTVSANECVRVHVKAMANNAQSKLIVLELFWNGKWSGDNEEMAHNLTIKTVKLKRE